MSEYTIVPEISHFRFERYLNFRYEVIEKLVIETILFIYIHTLT